MMGVDLLGLGSKHWPIKVTIDTVPQGTAIGAFWGTFGKLKPNLIKLLNTGKYPKVRIHPPWKNHVINSAWEVKRVAKKVNKIAKLYPTIQFFLSCGCEHYCADKKKIKKRINIIKKYAPLCIPVNAPSGPGATVKGVVTERHDHSGTAVIPMPYIVSTDGKDVDDLNITKYKSQHEHKSLICFLWCKRFNLFDTDWERYNIKPKDRTKAPTREHFRNVVKHL